MCTKYCNTKHAGWLALSFILSTGMILTTLPAAYAVPMMTNYQGTLKDSKGKLLNNSVVTLTFAVYDVPASGTALWTETHSGVPVKDGAFSVVLGSIVNIPETVAQGERYLGVTVNTDAEMTPRQALVSGFFAMRAGVAEAVASGAVSTDKLATSAVTTEKVADSAVTTTKLAPTAVTGDKLAVDSVTTDKIANGAVTTEKLSTEVQEKLAQGSSMPATVTTPVTMTTLNVTEKLKVGTNSLYLGSSTSVPGSTNEIYTDGGNLLLQSNTGNTNNTVISANADNTGKVGIGTSDPKAKLDVNGAVKISSNDGFDGFNFGKGLLATYDTSNRNGDISSLDLTRQGDPEHWRFTPLVLNGSKVSIAEQQPGLSPTPGNVGIGLPASGTNSDPKNKLDVAGSVAIGSGYAGTQTAPANGLAVEGSVDIGANTPTNTTRLQVGLNLTKAVIGNAESSNIVGWGQAYLGFNARREPSSTSALTNEPWVFDGNSANNGGSIIYGDVGGNLRFVTVESEVTTPVWSRILKDTDISNRVRMSIRNDGNVGIGTTWPNYKLEVIGTVKANSFIPPSDKRWKTNIKPLQGALDNVAKLQGVSYQWNTKDYPDKGFDDKPQIGFIAQEVEPILPELVSTDDKGYKAVEYDKMTAVLVEAVKELKAQNDALKTIVCKDHPEETICK